MNAGIDGAGRAAQRLAIVADGLGLAATPVFALMALLAAVRGAGAMAGLCGGAGVAMLDGMAWMYALMSVFHAAPWLRRRAGRRRCAPPVPSA
ncbi:hypothetical protein [Achromobacter insuavis]|uniref:hypothetical protein n=1 Tax=Achromobacter insuavis TaxID=1287735 RepID=UPI000A7A9A26|nr:hypothetical protein [Achromobacter insuavis]